MQQRSRSSFRTLVRYAAAVAGTLIATALTLAVQPTAPGCVFPFFLFAVVCSAVYGGWRVALATTALSAVATFFVLPSSLASTAAGQLLSIGAFVVTAVVVTAVLRLRSLQVARRQQALEESEERFKGIVTSATDAIISIDAAQRVVLFNAAAERAFGCAAADAIGQPIDRFIPERFRDTHREQVRLFGQTGVSGRAMSGRIVTALRTNGEEFPAEAQISRSTVGGRKHYTVILRDVSERERAAAALREEARKKDEFLAMLAHELRNPLAPIRNAVHLLRLIGPVEPRIARARDLIDRQVTFMTRLIDDLLDVSRITRGTILLRKERVDLSAMVEQAAEIGRPMIARRRHTLTLTCAPEPIFLEADPARLVQVISNLLNNAAKFTEPGGTITVTTERNGDAAIIRVRDTGVGIAPELLPKIFDLFVQGAAAGDTREGGLGIGLTLARRVVEQHGGRIDAHSPGRGGGSEFVVTWPALPATVPGAAVASRVAAAAPTACLQVLLVEDNLDVADSFKAVLEIQGHEVRAAHTGPAALDIATTLVPDIAFIDLGLPDLDGYEVARRLRTLPNFHATVLVALSGYGRDEDKRRAAEAGFARHLTKPVDPRDIDRLLTDVAARRRQDPGS